MISLFALMSSTFFYYIFNHVVKLNVDTNITLSKGDFFSERQCLFNKNLMENNAKNKTVFLAKSLA